MYRILMRTIAIFITPTLVGTLMLSGCSSKPNASDIAKELSETFQCPMLEVSDVQKTDGIAHGSSGYEVSYAYKLKLVGEGEAAMKLFPEWIRLMELLPRERREVERTMNGAATLDPGDASRDLLVKKAMLRKEQIEAAMTKIPTCQGQPGFFALAQMAAVMQEKIDSRSTRMSAPVGLQVNGAGMMTKAESGWHFSNRPMAALLTNSTVMFSSTTFNTPVQAVVWSNYTHDQRVFTAQVPSEGLCTRERSASEPGKYVEKCSFSTARTDMDIWIEERAAMLTAPTDTHQFLDEEMMHIADRNGEKVVSFSDLEGGHGKDFTTSSELGERSIRIIFTGSHLIEAIGTPKDSKHDDKAERDLFIKGVRAL